MADVTAWKDRESCPVCGGRLNFAFATVPMPVFQGCTKLPRQEGERRAMRWSECCACGALALSEIPPAEVIYQGAHATGIGATWDRHNAAFARFIGEHALQDVLEVGGGSGSLALAAVESGFSGHWTILEPNPLPRSALPAQVTLERGFYEAGRVAALRGGTVVLSHVLEHMQDIHCFADELYASGEAAQTVMVAWPALERWVGSGLAGALNFEHGIFLTCRQLECVFAAAGFECVGRKDFPEMLTEFLAFRRARPNAVVVPHVPGLADKAKAHFQFFVDLAAQLALRAERHQGPVVISPASVYTQILMASGLDQARISHLWDNAEIKQGRRLFGTSLIAEKPSAEKIDLSSGQPLFITFAGAHSSSIQQQFLGLVPGGVAVGPDENAGTVDREFRESAGAERRVTRLSGHSGDEVTALWNPLPVVRKRTLQAGRSERLQAQCKKQQEAYERGVATPKVIRHFDTGDSFGFDMEYVAAQSAAHIVRSGAPFPKAGLAKLLRFLAAFHTAEGEVPAQAFRDKLRLLKQAARENEVMGCLASRAEALIDGLAGCDWEGVPEGWCHGDLTLDNILIAQGERLILIDFDVPFAASPWLDFSKLLQDIDGRWLLRDQSLDVRQTAEALARLNEIREVLVPLLDEIAPSFLKRSRQFVLLDLLRTVPYAKTARTAAFVVENAERIYSAG